MQPLPQGVTGFDAPEEGVQVKRFTAACHATVLQVAGRLHHVRGSHEQVARNYHEALIILRHRPEMVRVLCNAHYPFVAFSTPAADEGDVRLEFIDCPELAEVFRAEFSIITRQEACAGVTDELVAQLGEAELAQMRYWKPKRIGDVIFNYWD